MSAADIIQGTNDSWLFQSQLQLFNLFLQSTNHIYSLV